MSNKSKYPKNLKLQAAEMFESGMTAKQIATELQVPTWLAFYLEHQGRKIKGTLVKKPFVPRPNGRHPRGEYNFQQFVPKSTPSSTFKVKIDGNRLKPQPEQIVSKLRKDIEKSFVEENVYPQPEKLGKQYWFAVSLLVLAFINIIITLAK